MMKVIVSAVLAVFLCFGMAACTVKPPDDPGKMPEPDPLKVVAFKMLSGSGGDQGHVSFGDEAVAWLPTVAEEYGFEFTVSNNWNNLNDEFLADYNLVMFIDDYPRVKSQQEAFERYMENGGGWIGFHVAVASFYFGSDPDNYSDDPAYAASRWHWYHDEFVGAGNYLSNTWPPTTATLKVETTDHAATAGMPATFTASPNEWYAWEHDLRQQPDITVLVTVDPSSFEGAGLGTRHPQGGANPYREVWTTDPQTLAEGKGFLPPNDGYIPVVWANDNYNMVYINMGHNLVGASYDAPGITSTTFTNEVQNKLLIDAMLGIHKIKK